MAWRRRSGNATRCARSSACLARQIEPQGGGPPRGVGSRRPCPRGSNGRRSPTSFSILVVVPSMDITPLLRAAETQGPITSLHHQAPGLLDGDSRRRQEDHHHRGCPLAPAVPTRLGGHEEDFAALLVAAAAPTRLGAHGEDLAALLVALAVEPSSRRNKGWWSGCRGSCRSPRHQTTQST